MTRGRRGDAAKAVLGLVSVALAAGLVGCTAAGTAASTTSAATTASPPSSSLSSSLPSSSPSSPSSPSTTAPAGHFVIDQDFPDPAVLIDGAAAYAFATNTPGKNIQVATASATDLRAWHVDDADALPQLPTWALAGNTWAPDVARIRGRFVMYFVARSLAEGIQCIGVATADSPTGPYRSAGARPLICPRAEGGAIDPSYFRDADGQSYLVWKNDGNCCHLDTWLQLQRLSQDGLTTAAPPTKLIKQSLPWEGSLVEAPQLVRHAGKYFLFYSANDYSTSAYAVGYAAAASLVGPYQKAAEPLLTSSSFDGAYNGPGGEEVVQGPDSAWHLLFHSWDKAHVERGMDFLNLTWPNNVPHLENSG